MPAISKKKRVPLEEQEGYIYESCGKIVDFSPLRGAPLTIVRMWNNQGTDLSFLTEARALKILECPGNSIADLTPLRGKPLQTLNASGNRITDLRPLAGLPLIELDIYGNPIADYAPLLELHQLQKLHMNDPKGFKGTLEPLRHHPSLQYIAIGYDGPYRPAAEFWADYDAQQAADKK